MMKFHQYIAASAAACLLSGSALAATLSPAAGEAPYFNRPTVVTSQLQRQAVEAQASAHPPAAGEWSAQDPAPSTSLSRAQVVQATAQAAKTRDGFPAASGEQPIGTYH